MVRKKFEGITWRMPSLEKYIFFWWESRLKIWSLRLGVGSQLDRGPIHTLKLRPLQNLSWWTVLLSEVHSYIVCKLFYNTDLIYVLWNSSEMILSQKSLPLCFSCFGLSLIWPVLTFLFFIFYDIEFDCDSGIPSVMLQLLSHGWWFLHHLIFVSHGWWFYHSVQQLFRYLIIGCIHVCSYRRINSNQTFP